MACQNRQSVVEIYGTSIIRGVFEDWYDDTVLLCYKYTIFRQVYFATAGLWLKQDMSLLCDTWSSVVWRSTAFCVFFGCYLDCFTCFRRRSSSPDKRAESGISIASQLTLNVKESKSIVPLKSDHTANANSCGSCDVAVSWFWRFLLKRSRLLVLNTLSLLNEVSKFTSRLSVQCSLQASCNRTTKKFERWKDKV